MHSIPASLNMHFSFRKVIASVHLFYKIQDSTSTGNYRITVENVTSKRKLVFYESVK